MLEKSRNCVLGIVPRLQQLDHMAGPPLRMAPITWACPVIVQTGQVTWAQGILKLAPFTGPYPVSGRAGPNKIRPERRLLDVGHSAIKASIVLNLGNK